MAAKAEDPGIDPASLFGDPSAQSSDAASNEAESSTSGNTFSRLSPVTKPYTDNTLELCSTEIHCTPLLRASIRVFNTVELLEKIVLDALDDQDHLAIIADLLDMKCVSKHWRSAIEGSSKLCRLTFHQSIIQEKARLIPANTGKPGPWLQTIFPGQLVQPIDLLLNPILPTTVSSPLYRGLRFIVKTCPGKLEITAPDIFRRREDGNNYPHSTAVVTMSSGNNSKTLDPYASVFQDMFLTQPPITKIRITCFCWNPLSSPLDFMEGTLYSAGGIKVRHLFRWIKAHQLLIPEDFEDFYCDEGGMRGGPLVDITDEEVSVGGKRIGWDSLVAGLGLEFSDNELEQDSTGEQDRNGDKEDEGAGSDTYLNNDLGERDVLDYT